MFKKLKQKIEEGVATAQGKPTPPKDAQSQPGERREGVSPSDGRPNSRRKLSTDSQDHSPATGTLINLQDESSSAGEFVSAGYNTPSLNNSNLNLSDSSTMSHGGATGSGPAELPISPLVDMTTRSRTSSISSQTSEASLFAPVPFSKAYPMPSDVESSSELEDSGIALNTVSKEDLYQYFKKMERRCQRYKYKFTQVMTVCRDLEKERDKLRNALTQAQDSAFRRISELKEQVQLDQLAKQHVEDNYRLMLDEKDELITVLHTQVGLLKQGQEVPDDLQNRQSDLQQRLKDKQPDTSTPNSTPSKDGDDSASTLREKVKRLELLLTKCKESIKSNKERNHALMTEKEHLLQKVDDKDEENRKLKETYRDKMTQIQAQMREAKKVIEELEDAKSKSEANMTKLQEDTEVEKAMAIAEVKQQMHVTMETKDQEMQAMHDSLCTLKSENEALGEKVATLTKEGQETLDKSREIIRRLKDEKRALESQMREKIETSEHSLEEERDTMLQELRRGKVEALQVMSNQMEQKVAELEAERVAALEARDQEWQFKILAKEEERVAALSERDVEWQAKIDIKEKEHQELLSQRMEELSRTLHEREEEMELAIEERELQKMAALSRKDTEEDQLIQEVEALRMRCNKLEKTIADLQNGHKAELSSLTQTIEDNAQRNKTTIEELRARQKARFEELKEEAKTHLNNKVAEIHAEHKLHIEQIQRQHEDILQNSSGEMDQDYRGRLEQINANHEKVAHEQLSQIEQFRKQVNDLQQRNDDLDKTLTTKIAELEQVTTSKQESSAKYKKERTNLLQDFSKKEQDYQSAVSEQTRQVEQLKQNLKQIIVENSKHQDDLKKSEENHKALITEFDNERRKLRQDLDNAQKELAQKIEHYEEVLRLEREGHERALIRKHDEEKLQHSAADEHSSALENKLKEANQMISELDKQVQQLTLSEREATTQSASLKTENQQAAEEFSTQRSNYEDQLRSANDKISVLESRITDLIEKDNQLNSDLDEAKNAYEAQISSQEATIESLQDKVTEYQATEEHLKAQLERTQVECDKTLEMSNAVNSHELNRLTQALATNEAEFKDMLQLLQDAQQQISDLSTRLKVLDEERDVELQESAATVTEHVTTIQKLQEDLALQTKSSKDLSDLVEEFQEKVQAQESDIAAKNQILSEQEQAVMNYKEQIKALDIELQGEKRNLEELETTKNQHIEMLQSKVMMLETSMNDQESSSGELLGRISNLEDSLMSKDKTIASFESKIKEFGEILERQTQEFGEKTKEVEEALKQKESALLEKDTLLADLKVVVKEMTGKVSDLELAEQEATSKLQEQVAKFDQLRAEAKMKIKELKTSLQEGEQANETALFQERAQHKSTLGQLTEVSETADNLQTELTRIQRKLDQETTDHKAFKESVKAQFEQRQANIKETVQRIHADSDLRIQELEAITVRKMEKLEKQKDAEKDKALSEMRVENMLVKTEAEKRVEEVQNKYEDEMKFLKAEVESGKVRLQELTQQYQSEKEALMKHAAIDKDDVEGEKTQLREEKQQMEQRVAEMLNESAEQKGEKQQMEQRVEELMNQSGVWQDERQQLEEQVKELSSQSVMLREEKQQLEERMTEVMNQSVELQKSAEGDQTKSVEFEQQLTELKARESELLAQLEQVTEEKGDTESELKREMEKLTQEKEAIEKDLKQYIEKLEDDTKVSAEKHEQQLIEIAEKHESELQEKVKSFEESENKLCALQNDLEMLRNELQDRDRLKSELEASVVSLEATRGSLERDLEERTSTVERLSADLEALKQDHQQTISKIEEEKLQTSAVAEDHGKVLQERDQQLKDSEAKLVQLKEKAQGKINELRRELKERDETVEKLREYAKDEVNRSMSELSESHSQEIADYKQKIEDLDRAHVEALQECQKRIQDMSSNDDELQAQLKTLTEKLNSTEEELTANIGQFRTTVQSYQEQIEAQKVAFDAERETMKQTLAQQTEHYTAEASRNESKLKDKLTSSEEFGKQLQNDLDASLSKLKLAEEGLAKAEEEVVAVEKKWQQKLQELKQKYLTKLKEFQNNHEAKMKEVVNSSAQGDVEKEQVYNELLELRTKYEESTSELDELREKYDETDKSFNTSQSMVLELQASNEEIVQKVSLVNAELATSKQCAQDLEQSIVDKDSIIVDLTRTLDEQQSNIVKLKEEHVLELGAQAQKSEEETNEKLSELKKKAEMRLGQIKKQLQGNNSEAMSELNDSVLSLQNRVTELEQELSVKQEMVLKLQESESLLNAEKDSVLVQVEELGKEKMDIEKSYTEQLEKLRSEHEVELASRTSTEDSSQPAEARSDSDTKLSDLQTENRDLKRRIEKLRADMDNLQSEKETDLKMATMEHQREFSTLRTEYDGRIEELEEDHKSRVKQLVKEFNLKMAEKEQEFQDTFSDAIDKGRLDEDKLFYEHRKETEELHKSLYEKDNKMEELIDTYEVQIQAETDIHKAQIQELDDKVSSLHSDMIALDAKHNIEKQALLDQIAQLSSLPAQISPGSQDVEFGRQNQLAAAALQSGSSSSELLRQQVIELTKHMDKIKMKHSREILELQSQIESGHTGAASGGGDNMPQSPQVHALEVHNMDLQAKVLQQSGELAQLKIRDRELTQQLQITHTGNHDHSNYNNTSNLDNSHHDAGTLSEITEIEYLRNILFEYMQGKETKTLAKVICTVVKFSNEQTRRVMEREDARVSTWLPHIG